MVDTVYKTVYGIQLFSGSEKAQILQEASSYFSLFFFFLLPD